MKNILRTSLLAILMTSLCSCGGTNSSSSSSTTTSQSSSSSSSTTTPITNEWKGDALTCLTSYVGEQIPYIEGFNTSFTIGCVDSSTKPYFNPYIENSKDYTNEYKQKLLQYGFEFDGVDTGDGYDKYEYHHNYIYLSHAFYKSNSKNWFDVYTFNDLDPSEDEPGYQAKITPSDFTKKYEDHTMTIGGYTVQSKNVMNNSSKIQFQKATGSIIIKGNNINKIIIRYIQYPQSLIVKSGTSSSDSKVLFNNANEYLTGNCSYVELSNPTLGSNTPRICTISEILIY